MFKRTYSKKELTEDIVNEHRNVLELYLIYDLIYIDVHLMYIGCLIVGQ